MADPPSLETPVSPAPAGRSEDRATRPRRRLLTAVATAALGAAAIGGAVVGRLSVDAGGGGQAAQTSEQAAAYRQELRGDLVDLSAARAAKLGALAQASTGSEQRAGLRALARLHLRTADAVAGIGAPMALRGSQRSLVRSLEGLGARYRQLGNRVGSAGTDRYWEARQAVRRAEAALRQRLRSIDEAAT